jgi:hypothetical protein
MVVVCSEGISAGNRPLFGPAFRAAPVHIFPACICPIAKLQFIHLRNSNWAEVTSLLREAEVYPAQRLISNYIIRAILRNGRKYTKS